MFLAIVQSAAMNIGVHVSLWIMVFFGIWPGVGFQDHMVALYSLEFFCKKILSLLPYSFIHLFNLLFISIQTHIFIFFFGLSIQTVTYFVAWNIPVGHWEFLQTGSCVPLTCSHFFKKASLLSGIVRGSRIIPHCHPLESAISPRIPGSFHWRMMFSDLRKVKKVKSLSRVQLFVTPWTVTYQAPLSMGFSRQ